jgi:hypothetical protein
MAPQRPGSGLEWLGRFERTLHIAHVEVDLGGEQALAILKLRGDDGEAVTYADDAGATILFRSNEPTISAVLEELAHALQARKKRFYDKDIQEMGCLQEIEAKECLLEHGAALGIPAQEEAITRGQIEKQRAILESLRWRR